LIKEEKKEQGWGKKTMHAEMAVRQRTPKLV
jgi:hypothetical protein